MSKRVAGLQTNAKGSVKTVIVQESEGRFILVAGSVIKPRDVDTTQLSKKARDSANIIQWGVNVEPDTGLVLQNIVAPSLTKMANVVKGATNLQHNFSVGDTNVVIEFEGFDPYGRGVINPIKSIVPTMPNQPGLPTSSQNSKHMNALVKTIIENRHLVGESILTHLDLGEATGRVGQGILTLYFLWMTSNNKGYADIREGINTLVGESQYSSKILNRVLDNRYTTETGINKTNSVPLRYKYDLWRPSLTDLGKVYYGSLINQFIIESERGAYINPDIKKLDDLSGYISLIDFKELLVTNQLESLPSLNAPRFKQVALYYGVGLGEYSLHVSQVKDDLHTSDFNYLIHLMGSYVAYVTSESEQRELSEMEVLTRGIVQSMMDVVECS